MNDKNMRIASRSSGHSRQSLADFFHRKLVSQRQTCSYNGDRDNQDEDVNGVASAGTVMPGETHRWAPVLAASA